MNEQRLEELTVALNRQLYAESIGLPCDEQELERLTIELEAEYRRAVTNPASQDMAVDGLADMLSTRWHQRWLDAVESVLIARNLATSGEPATWHNWKRMEQALDAQARRRLFAQFVSQSEQLTPLIEERYSAMHQLYAEHVTTPLHVFACREGTTPEAMRALVMDIGLASREPFQAALQDLASQVFWGEVTAAELRALYLNRMYEPLAPLFARRDPLADVRVAFSRLGFDITRITVDLTDRPKKYAGAFCFPVQIPGDVRISVRPASPHHLEDMLFHEFGHAVHFASIDPTLPFADRYWMHAGTHETIATLFESLLSLPEFLSETMWLNEPQVRQLVAFDRFKNLLTGTWLAAAGLTVCDAWMEHLDWTQIEQRYAQYCEQFTGIAMPPGFARLDLYVNRVDPYPLGYVMAAARVAHWLDQLQANWGVRWWADPCAGQSIRERIQPGGALKFEDEWLDSSAFMRRWITPNISPRV
jgi:hypothetical protein